MVTRNIGLNIADDESSIKMDISKPVGGKHKLTFTGAVEAEYDGSKPVTVTIPGSSNVIFYAGFNNEINRFLFKDLYSGEKVTRTQLKQCVDAGAAMTIMLYDGDKFVASTTVVATYFDPYDDFAIAYGFNDMVFYTSEFNSQPE